MSIDQLLFLGLIISAGIYLVTAIINKRPAASPRETNGRSLGRRLIYRCEDGKTDYVFSFIRIPNGTWRVYIADQPSYNNRSETLHATHRLVDEHGHFICWTDPLSSEEAARNIAKLWAERTQRYIATGEEF